MGCLVPQKRILPGQGIMIAFVGVDGSGKTSLVKHCIDVLGAKLDVKLVYLGTEII
jgi:thymidylate kinase